MTSPVRGRASIEVDAVPIVPLLKKLQPTHIKVDVEGDEWKLLPSLWASKSAKVIFAELHYNTSALRSAMKKVLAQKPKAWKVTKKPSFTKKGRATLAMWER